MSAELVREKFRENAASRRRRLRRARGDDPRARARRRTCAGSCAAGHGGRRVTATDRAARDRRDRPRVRRGRRVPARVRATSTPTSSRRRSSRTMKRARALRRHDPRGVRRARPRSPHLRADPDRALARLDVALGRPQHALHLRLDDRDARHRRAARALPAADGDGRAAVRVLDDRAARGLGRPGRSAPRAVREGDEFVDHRPEDVGDERAAGGRDHAPRDHRSRRRAAPPRHDRRSSSRRSRRSRSSPGCASRAKLAQARLQGRRDDRARSSTASARPAGSVLGGESAVGQGF